MVKQQHYVPQFYLREFASEDEQIWVYDKIEDKVFKTGIKNIAAERFFYDSNLVESATGEKQLVEKFLSTCEGEFHDKISRLLMRLRSGGYCRLHPETRMTIALFASMQIFRTKEFRVAAIQSAVGLKEAFKRLGLSEGNAGELFQAMDDGITEEGASAFQSAFILNFDTVSELAAILDGHIWLIARRHEVKGFYCSDSPVTKRGYVNDEFLRGTGYATRGVEIHIPISHDYEILLYEREYHHNMKSKDGEVMNLSVDLVNYHRQFAVIHSTRFVFCKDNDFEFAKMLCERDPSLRDMDRLRFRIS
jgi:hypothetical protein